MEAKIVIDLGFGDSGKGAAIDSLSISAKNPIGIRFSGGQQCGHTVYLDKDKMHIHAIFASCALRGFPTYLTEHCTFYLPTLMEESLELARKGGSSNITMHPFTMVTTPYDIAWNRLSEKVNQHGSVGLGIGATMHRSLKTGYKLYASHMQYAVIAKAKLREIKNYYIDRIRREDVMFTVNDFLEESALNEDIFNDSLAFFSTYAGVEDYRHLASYQTLLFEGSQGVMLDMDHGIFPNVTYANTTSKNAIAVCRKFGIKPSMYYVTRCYITRHGNGWIPNEQTIKLINTECEINIQDEWQGEFRVRELDYDMLNYALEMDDNYILHSLTTRNVIVSCMDQRVGFKFREDKLPTGINFFYRSSPISAELVTKTLDIEAKV